MRLSDDEAFLYAAAFWDTISTCCRLYAPAYSDAGTSRAASFRMQVGIVELFVLQLCIIYWHATLDTTITHLPSVMFNPVNLWISGRRRENRGTFGRSLWKTLDRLEIVSEQRLDNFSLIRQLAAQTTAFRFKIALTY